MPMCLLEEKVRCRLRSGVAIGSVAQCVGELVENAIDAGAKCIAVRVDFSKYKIKVIDNGEGVARKDFDLIGQRYVTSKCHTLADLENNLWHLGYRGEALASIIDTTGTVEFTSRHHLSQWTYSKLFYHGRPTSITLSSISRPSVGSTISLHDLFYNLPVRRKAISAVLEMENIRLTLQCLSLANPSVSFSLRNDALGECVMQTRKTNSLLGSFSVLFGADKANNMREVALKRGTFLITGILSIQSHYSKHLQFIFINGRVVRKTALHSCVNNIIANSLIACNLSRQADPSKWHNQDNSPKRATERHAVYVLMIGCPRVEYDICFDPAKTLIEFRDWEAVLDLLTELVCGFLHQHSLTFGLGCMEGQGGRETPPSLEFPDMEQSNTDAGLLTKPPSWSLSCFQPEVKRMSCPTLSQDSSAIEVRKEESRKAVLDGADSVSESEMGHSVRCSRGGPFGLDSVSESEIGHSVRCSGGVLSGQDSVSESEIGHSVRCSRGGPSGQDSVSESEMGCSVRCSRGGPSGQDSVGAPVVSQNQVPMALKLDKPLRSPLHFQSLSSKLSCLLRNGKRRQDGRDGDERHHTGGLHSTTRSHHRLQTTASTPPPVDSTPPISSFSFSEEMDSNCLDNRASRKMFLYPSSFSGSHVTASTLLPLRREAEPLVPLEGICEGGGCDGIRTQEGYLLTNMHEVSSRDHVSSSMNHDTVIVGEVSRTSCGGGPVSHCCTAAAACDEPAESSACFNDISRKEVLDCCSIKLQCAGNPESSLWRMSYDPVTTMRVFIHKRTGETSTRNPESLIVPTCNPPVQIHTNCNDSSIQARTVCSSTQARTVCSSTQARPVCSSTQARTVCSSTQARPVCSSTQARPVCSSTQARTVCSSTQARTVCSSTQARTVCSSTQARTVCSSTQARMVCSSTQARTVCSSTQARTACSSTQARTACSSTQARTVCSSTQARTACSSTQARTACSSTQARTACSSTQARTICSSTQAKTVCSSTQARTVCSSTQAGMINSHQTGWAESTDDSLCSSSNHGAICRLPLAASCFLPSAKRLKMDCGLSESDLPAAVLGNVGSQGREERILKPTWEGGVFEKLLQNWKNPSFLASQENIASLGSSNRNYIKVHNIINSYKFSKEMLRNVKVLGQVDKKFIACMVGTKDTGDHNLLVLFDQHAAHERVRLELLLKDLHKSSSVSGARLTIKASRVQPPLLLHLTPAEKKFSRLFRRQLEDLGVSLTYGEGGSVGVASLPSVLMEREVSERRRGRPAVALELVQDMIVSHLEVLKSTAGGSQVMPTSLTNILNSQACHENQDFIRLDPYGPDKKTSGAVRFGDVLTVGECEELIQSLSSCKLPFQCAHGRPSLVPVLDLDILKKKYPSEAQPSKLCTKLSQLLM